MKRINERIATLTAEKERIMTDYLKADTDSEIQMMLGMENMRISMELKFLNELNTALVMNSILNYKLFRFWMIVLGITGWVLCFVEYCS